MTLTRQSKYVSITSWSFVDQPDKDFYADMFKVLDNLLSFIVFIISIFVFGELALTG